MAIRLVAVVLWSIPRGGDEVGDMPQEPTKGALNESTKAFGDRVRDRRNQLGLSQEKLAAICSVHWTMVGKIERGQRSLRLETILKLAAGLDIDAGALVSGLPVPQDDD